MNSSETLAYSVLPCATVLSVAGFFTFPALFPLGAGLFSAGFLMPDYPRVEEVSHIPDSYSGL